MSEIAKCPLCGKEPKQYRDDVSGDTNYECCSASITGTRHWNRYAAAMELVEARQTISECLQDTAFRNGVKAGWNAALIKDDTEAQKMYEQLTSDKDGRLVTLKAARAEVDRLIAESKGVKLRCKHKEEV